jgi:hypothetical protein
LARPCCARPKSSWPRSAPTWPCGRRAAPDGPRERLCALCHQDQGQRRAGGGHRQLGQRPDAAGEGRHARWVLKAAFTPFMATHWARPPPWRCRHRQGGGRGRLAAQCANCAQSEAFYRSFRVRFPKPQDDYVHMRMQLLVEALTQAIEAASKQGAAAVAVAPSLLRCSWSAPRYLGGAVGQHAGRRSPVSAALGGRRNGPPRYPRGQV